MGKPFFVSLGAGENQIELIKEAKKMGYSIIGVDINSAASGFALCDICIHESIFNYRRIFFKLKDFLPHAQMEALACASFGKGILSWAHLSRYWQLAGPKESALHLLSDKYQVRNFFDSNPIDNPLFAQPKFMTLSSVQKKSSIEQVGFPIILKTTNDFAKKNIFEFSNFSQLKPYLSKRFLSSLGKKPEEIILEEKILGDEITVTGFAFQNTFYLTMISDKITSKKAPFIELEHRFPSQYQNLHEAITKMHQQMIDQIQPYNCPLVSEWKVFKDQLYLIEISAQIPGEFLPNFLIPKALQYNYYRQLVHLGKNQKIEKVKAKPKKVRVVFQPTRLEQQEWKQFIQQSAFYKILNPLASNKITEIQNNNQRYAVAGFVG